MKIIETTFERLPRERLVIGFEGENLRATVRIDCASVFAEYPNATPALIVKPLFADAYPVVVDRNGTDVDWLITSEILSFSGDGEIQLIFYKDQVICKSAVSKIRVSRSLTVTGEMPDPVVQWIENANRKLAEVDAQIVELEGMVDTATDAATRAEQSASTASTKAEQAAGSAATATEKATEATNAAGTATAKAAEAQTAAQTATEKANAAAESERIATAKAGDATTAATTATTKAEQATEAAQTATEKAGDASASATAAHASATDAASSATAAQAAQTAARASETAASTSASQAAQSEQNAGTAAQTATQKAAEATQSATDAAASATNAATSAETASTKAGEAAASAQAVAETAEQLADSLEQIEQNKQDIADLDERKANIDGYYPDMTVGNAEQLNSSKYVENSEPYTLRTSGGSSDIGNREYLDAVVGGTVAWNQAVRDEASQNETDFAPIVTVTDAVEDAAGVKVQIEPVQDLHGYDHPWPAGCGKNLLPYATIESPLTKQGITFVRNQDGSIAVNGTSTASFSQTFVEFALEPGNYYFNCGNGFSLQPITYIYIRDVDNSRTLAEINSNSIGVDKPFSIDVQTNVRFYMVFGSTDLVISGTLYPMIRLSSVTDATYEPYSNICPITGWDGVQIVVSPTTDAEDGQTYSITLPTEAGTVYGGELTVNADGSGSLVVDMARFTASWGSMSLRNTFDGWERRNTSISLKPASPYTSAQISNVAQLSVRNDEPYPHFYCLESVCIVVLPESTPSDTEIEMVYTLATPLTYTLTASQIRTLLGQNNVWADTGDLALTYTGTDEHLTLESGKKYLARISGTDSMLLGSGQEITAAKGTDNVFDLTQMFGAAVADYVFGQGASFFRRWFPKPVYPYNAGELRHVEGLSAHEMVGFNAWDEEWENGRINANNGLFISGNGVRSKNKIKVLPGTAYYAVRGDYADAGAITLFYYDANDNYISYDNKFGKKVNFTTPANANYLYLNIMTSSPVTVYNHDICISLAHNNSRNGEYEPYEKHSYPLDSSVVLRGIPKVGANGVYWDGDRYLPDGTVERRYGVVDLGTLNYSTNWGSPCYDVFGVISNANAIISKYSFAPNVNNRTMPDKAWTFSSSRLFIKDSDYSTPAAFKAAMSGVLLIYELATPTTETAQPYHSTQWVSDWGTEEFVSTGLVPIGHETRYPANLRDKLQHLPDAASGNGSYLITQTDGQMVLTPFPAPPSTAGNYVLKATVTGGVATYTWEVVT